MLGNEWKKFSIALAALAALFFIACLGYASNIYSRESIIKDAEENIPVNKEITEEFKKQFIEMGRQDMDIWIPFVISNHNFKDKEKRDYSFMIFGRRIFTWTA